MGIKYKKLYEEGRWNEIVDDARCPKWILTAIVLRSENDDIRRAAKETFKKKEEYRKEREALEVLRAHYKELVEKVNKGEDIDIEEEEFIMNMFWNLKIVNSKYYYSVIVPKFGDINNDSTARRIYENSRTGYLEIEFFEGVMDRKIRV